MERRGWEPFRVYLPRTRISADSTEGDNCGTALDPALVAVLAATTVVAEQLAAKDAPAWTIDHTWAPTKQVQFEVSEGTWPNLDVSPDA